MNIRNMRIRGLALTATFALMVGAAQAAPAELVTLVEAVELSPAHIILPGSVNGMVTYRACDSGAPACDEEYSRARLTPETRFMVGSKTVKFEDFRQDFANVRSSKTGYALLSVDTKSKTITSIQIQG